MALLEFDDEPANRAKIKVIGVGGGGGNAVNTMIESASTASSSSWPTPTCRRSSQHGAASRSRSAAR